MAHSALANGVSAYLPLREAIGRYTCRDDPEGSGVLVTAKKRPDAVPDEILTEQVEVALHSDPFFYDEHVTVTVKNGVVLLEGVVFDDSDVGDAIRIAKKIAGVKYVVADLYIPDGQ
jgi:osmotically-inducible protein OsmY